MYIEDFNDAVAVRWLGPNNEVPEGIPRNLIYHFGQFPPAATLRRLMQEGAYTAGLEDQRRGYGVAVWGAGGAAGAAAGAAAAGLAAAQAGGAARVAASDRRPPSLFVSFRFVASFRLFSFVFVFIYLLLVFFYFCRILTRDGAPMFFFSFFLKKI